ncbi:MAG: Ig-like domain repeat protein [Candidatus Xenobia bacterium]
MSRGWVLLVLGWLLMGCQGYQTTPLPLTLPTGTTTTVTSTPAQPVEGQPVTLTASVTVPGISNLSLSGAVVQFLDGTTSLGTATMSGDQASLNLQNLSTGAHTITATFPGVTTVAGSTSAPLALTVLATSTTTLQSSANPSTPAQSVTFTATVAGVDVAGTPTGTVTFVLDNVNQPAATLAAGQATFTTTALTTGNHTVSAVYSGDKTFAASTSNTIGQAVSATSAQRLYVANANDGTVGVLSLNASGDVQGSAVTALTDPGTANSAPLQLVLNPTATRLYATNDGSTPGNIGVLPLSAIGDLTGASVTTPADPLFNTNQDFPQSAVVNPAGTRLYVTNNSQSKGDCVTQFTLDAAGNIVANSGVDVTNGNKTPAWVLVNPAGTRLYVTDATLNVLLVYTLDGSGNITSAAPAAFPTDTQAAASPVFMVLNPSASRIYISNGTGDVAVFSLNATGDVVANSLVNTPTDPNNSSSSPRGLFLNPTATRLYVPNGGAHQQNIGVLPLNSTGDVAGPAVTTPADPNNAQPNPQSVTVNPAGTRLYVANFSGQLVTFNLSGSGDIVAGSGVDTPTDPNNANPGPNWVIVHP